MGPAPAPDSDPRLEPLLRYSHRDVILGAAAHDVYHAGQIRLLRTMWQDR